MQELVFECDDQGICLDQREACNVLNETLKEIVSESWPIGENRPVKGYELKINVNDNEMLFIREGNITSSFKGSLQSFSRGSSSIDISFRAYD